VFGIIDSSAFINYMENRKLSICENRDRFKYNEKGEIEWMFSPRYGWNNIPEEVKKEIIRFNLK
jgi:hypothetical protein